MFKSRFEKNFSPSCLQLNFFLYRCSVCCIFLTTGLGLKNIHNKESASLIGLAFELSFFFSAYSLLSIAALCGLSLHHRVMQYKVKNAFSPVFAFNGENSEIAIFTCIRYERSSSQLKHLHVSFFRTLPVKFVLLYCK